MFSANHTNVGAVIWKYLEQQYIGHSNAVLPNQKFQNPKSKVRNQA